MRLQVRQLPSVLFPCLLVALPMFSCTLLLLIIRKVFNFRKKVAHCWDSNHQPNLWLGIVSSAPYRLSYICSVVLSGMLLEFPPLLRLQPAAEWNLITASTRGNKLEVHRWWALGVWHLMCWCRQLEASYKRDRQTDRQTDRISALLYRWIDR